MFLNLFEADSYDEEALIKIVTSLTVTDLIKQLKQGEVLASEWLESRMTDAQFRVIVQGRRVGVNNNGLIDLLNDPKRNGIWMPGDRE